MTQEWRVVVRLKGGGLYENVTYGPFRRDLAQLVMDNTQTYLDADKVEGEVRAVTLQRRTLSAWEELSEEQGAE